jgi:hypothetical protein
VTGKPAPVHAWAPVSPAGLICFSYAGWLARDAKANLLKAYDRAIFPHDWPTFRKKGWQIIKIVVTAE